MRGGPATAPGRISARTVAGGAVRWALARRLDVDGRAHPRPGGGAPQRGRRWIGRWCLVSGPLVSRARDGRTSSAGGGGRRRRTDGRPCLALVPAVGRSRDGWALSARGVDWRRRTGCGGGGKRRIGRPCDGRAPSAHPGLGGARRSGAPVGRAPVQSAGARAPARQSPAACTRARITRTSSPISGCHWTPRTQGDEGSSIASTVPSAAWAVGIRPSPSRSTAWWW